MRSSSASDRRPATRAPAAAAAERNGCQGHAGDGVAFFLGVAVPDRPRDGDVICAPRQCRFCLSALSMSDHSHHRPVDDDTPEAHHRFGLRVIALYKMVQALGLLLAAAAAFHLERQSNVDRLIDWLEHLSLSGTGALRQHLVDALAGLGPQRFVVIGLIAIAYAALFITEGIGLWLRKHW